MGLNTLGLGIILSLRDGASLPAARAAGALGQLDTAARTFSSSFNASMATAFEGMAMVAAGSLLAAGPIAFIKSTFETQKAMGYIANSGIKDLKLMKDAALDFTNTWAGTTQAEFLDSIYQIKSGLYELSDALVAKMATNTGVLAKATKSSVKEIEELMPIMYGILRPSRLGITDEKFIDELAGGLAYSVKIYRATGKYMGDAFSQATAIATQEGISMQEQFAILGQLQQTMTGSEAGTKMRALAVATPRAVVKAKKEGIDIKLLDQKGMVLPLIDILQNVKDKYGTKLTADAMEQIRKMFGSREATSTIINLLPYVDKLKKDSQAIKQAMDGGVTVAMEMAKSAADQMSDSWTVFLQRANNLKQAIGEALIPAFMPGVKLIGILLVGLQKLVYTVPWLIRIVGTITMLVAGILVLTGAIFILSAASQIVNAALALMKARMILLRAEFVKLMITMWPFIVMAGLLYLAFKYNFMGISDSFQNVIKWFQKLWDKAKMVWAGLSELMSTFSNDSGIISAEMRDKLIKAGLWDFTVKMFMLYTRLTYLWKGIKQGFGEFWEGMVGTLKPIGAFLVNYVLKPLQKVLAWVGVHMPLLDAMLKPSQENANSWEKIGVAIGKVAGFLAFFSIFGKIIGPVLTFGRIFFNIGKIIFGVGRIALQVFLWIAGIVAAILGVPVWVAAVIVAAVAALIFIIVKFRKQIWAVLSSIGGAIGSFFGGLWDGTKKKASEFFSWIGGKFKWVEGVVKKVKDFLGLNDNVEAPKITTTSQLGMPGTDFTNIRFGGPISPVQTMSPAKTNSTVNKNNNTINNIKPNDKAKKEGSSNDKNPPSSNQPIVIHVPVKINGKEVAKATATYINDEKKRK